MTLRQHPSILEADYGILPSGDDERWRSRRLSRLRRRKSVAAFEIPGAKSAVVELESRNDIPFEGLPSLASLHRRHRFEFPFRFRADFFHESVVPCSNLEGRKGALLR